jgi:hypothetical protein
MGNKTRKRPRDLPHKSRVRETPEITRASFHGSASRPEKRAMATSDSGHVRAMAKRVQGQSGSWPAPGAAAPKAPQICMIYEDLTDLDKPMPVFGQYPVGMIEKLLPWLKCRRHEILHVCSGALSKGDGIRVDLRPDARPDVVADGRALPFADASFAAVLCDPPYTEQYAKNLYGVEYPRPAHLLAEAARVVRPGGIIGFVHYLVPMPPPRCRFVRAFGLSAGFGFPMRAITLFAREQDALPGM